MSRSENRIPKLRSRGRENRRKLLREAERLLAEDRGSSMKFCDVFEAAGVSRGSAYRIYNGVDDLIQDLAGEWLTNFVEYLGAMETDGPPDTWMMLSDQIVERGTRYWADTAETLKVMPRIRSNAPASHKSSVRALSNCLDEMFHRHFDMPDVPGWFHKLSFYTELANMAYSDAMRAEGRISGQRLKEAQKLGFKRCLIPRSSRRKEIKVPQGLQIIACRNLSEAIDQGLLPANKNE